MLKCLFPIQHRDSKRNLSSLTMELWQVDCIRGLFGFGFQVGASSGNTGLSGTWSCWVQIIGECSTFYMKVFQGWWWQAVSLPVYQLLSSCPLVWTRLWAGRIMVLIFRSARCICKMYFRAQSLEKVLPGSICEKRLKTRAVPRKTRMLKFKHKYCYWIQATVQTTLSVNTTHNTIHVGVNEIRGSKNSTTVNSDNAVWVCFTAEPTIHCNFKFIFSRQWSFSAQENILL